MDERTRELALHESRKALDLMAASELTREQQDAVVADCVANFDKYVNPGILEFRKSCSTDYTSVEWCDEGSVFCDIHGKEFIDCLGGYGIYMLGHRHPQVVKAVHDQLGHQALHSQELLDPNRGYLSELLAMVTPGRLSYSFFCNSGTEANEGALKLAKLNHFRRRGERPAAFISTLRGFHGKSLGSLSVTGKAAWREPFYPLLSNVYFVPYGDADALQAQCATLDHLGIDVCAFIVEPIQGESGAHVPPDDYFPKVREICDRWKALLITDEVQTGMGRTGTFWGIEHWGVEPDIMTMGKALGGGVIPIGNWMATPEAFEPMIENPYIHTTTFGGNPVATAAAIAAVHVTLEERIPEQAAEKGAYLKGRLEGLFAENNDLCDEVRGKGLLIGMDFCSGDVGWAVTSGLFEEGVLTGGTLFSARTFRIEPPAVITREQMDQVVERLERVIARVRPQVKSGELAAVDA
jgi:putrescine aminotransferase